MLTNNRIMESNYEIYNLFHESSRHVQFLFMYRVTNIAIDNWKIMENIIIIIL